MITAQCPWQRDSPWCEWMLKKFTTAARLPNGTKLFPSSPVVRLRPGTAPLNANRKPTNTAQRFCFWQINSTTRQLHLHESARRLQDGEQRGTSTHSWNMFEPKRDEIALLRLWTQHQQKRAASNHTTDIYIHVYEKNSYIVAPQNKTRLHQVPTAAVCALCTHNNITKYPMQWKKKKKQKCKQEVKLKKKSLRRTSLRWSDGREGGGGTARRSAL